MNFCSSCGASLADGAASFCSECGHPLKPISARPPTPAEEAQHSPEDSGAGKVIHKAPAPPVRPETDIKDMGVQRPDDTKKRKERAKERRRPKRKAPAPTPPADEVPADPPPALEDGYDGYYEDILPIDEGQRTTEKLDPDMIKKIAMVAGGALLIVIAAVVALLIM